MARQTIKHGATLDVATVDEVRKLLAEQSGQDYRGRVRVRAVETTQLLGGGDTSGVIDIYSVTPGFEFEIRRVAMYMNRPLDDSSPQNVQLTLAKWVEFLRSGTHIEYAQPVSAGAGSTPVIQIPGVQTWGAEQGPYLVNGETFQIRGAQLVGSASLTVMVEGILSRVRAQ